MRVLSNDKSEIDSLLQARKVGLADGNGMWPTVPLWNSPVMLRLTGLMSNPGQMRLAYVTYSETGQDEGEGWRGGKKTVHDFSDSSNSSK